MDIYCTSKNSGPNSLSTQSLYIGTSLDEAIKKVGFFVPWEKPPLNKYAYIPCFLPTETKYEVIKLYVSNFLWISIVRIWLCEEEE